MGAGDCIWKLTTTASQISRRYLRLYSMRPKHQPADNYAFDIDGLPGGWTDAHLTESGEG